MHLVPLPILAALIVALVPSLRAQPTPGATAAAHELLELLNIEAVMRAGVSATFESQAKAQPEIAPLVPVMQQWADSIMTLRALGPQLAAIYTDAFTEAELRELVAFYKTPVGRKLAQVSPDLARRGSEVGAAAAERHSALLQRMIMAEIERLQSQTPP